MAFALGDGSTDSLLRRRCCPLGKYPDVKLADARRARDEARNKVLADVDPAEERRDAKFALLVAHKNSFETVARAWHKVWAPTKHRRYSDDVLARLTAPIQFGRAGAALEADLVIPGRVAANPMEHEAAVVNYLQNSPLYGEVGSQVHLKVTLQDGTTYRIIPDALEQLESGAYRIHDAKFGFDARDMINGEIRLSNNQTPTFPAIANGTAQVEMVNSQTGRALFGRNFEVGKAITIDPQIKIYVNTPQGIAVRTNPFNY